jgi:hypothetical protein
MGDLSLCKAVTAFKVIDNKGFNQHCIVNCIVKKYLDISNIVRYNFLL